MSQPIDRRLLKRDLDRVAKLLTEGLTPKLAALPFPLNRLARPVALNSMLSRACSVLASAPDDELVPVIDALGRELGAIRGQLAPLEEPQPELAEAAGRLIERLT